MILISRSNSSISWSLLPSGGLCETWFIRFSSFVNIKSKRLLCVRLCGALGWTHFALKNNLRLY